MRDVMQYVRSFFLQRAAGYCLIALASLFVIAPLGELQTQFNGQCLLYSDVVYENFNVSTPFRSPFRLRFGPETVCEYNISVSALFCLTYSVIMVAVYIFLYRKEKNNKEIDLGQMLFLVHGVSELAIMLLILVSACTISHGFTTLCGDITDTKIPGFTVDSCSDAEKFKMMDYDLSNFYVCLSIATAGAWFQWLFWLLQSGFVMWKLWRLNMLPVLPDWMKPGSSG